MCIKMKKISINEAWKPSTIRSLKKNRKLKGVDTEKFNKQENDGIESR